ncbi:glutaredoxin [Herbiconiux sp. L3-i23]|uniref:glutaredoxin n=1 Tax=Herbiconiux sp. L3-i23 TaxID=2905871 RepID=UPI00207006D8|nr:glutaredoxin [Herbiconiux sp. L3-i23]BDI23333.1 hypothetical protein L3i23_21090 [Herbiconiux sp. L3-i23]
MSELSVTLYSSSFCGACAATRRTLGRVEALLDDRVRWREVNVADAPDESEDRAITTTPTVVITDRTGAEVMRASGVPTANQVLAAIGNALA